MIACRAGNPVKEKVRQKISMYTNVPMRRVLSMHDVVEHLPDSRIAPRCGDRSRSADAAGPARSRRSASRRSGSPQVGMVRRSHRQGAERDHHRGHRQIRRPARCVCEHHQGRRALRRASGRGCEVQVDRHDADRRGDNVEQRAGGLPRDHRARRVWQPRRRRERSSASATPAKTGCRIWGCASASRWR